MNNIITSTALHFDVVPLENGQKESADTGTIDALFEGPEIRLQE